MCIPLPIIFSPFLILQFLFPPISHRISSSSHFLSQAHSCFAFSSLPLARHRSCHVFVIIPKDHKAPHTFTPSGGWRPQVVVEVFSHTPGAPPAGWAGTVSLSNGCLRSSHGNASTKLLTHRGMKGLVSLDGSKQRSGIDSARATTTAQSPRFCHNISNVFCHNTTSTFFHETGTSTAPKPESNLAEKRFAIRFPFVALP